MELNEHLCRSANHSNASERLPDTRVCHLFCRLCRAAQILLPPNPDFPPRHVPQISHAATSAALSDRKAHPFFARVVAPDTKQAVAMIEVVKHFNWPVLLVKCAFLQLSPEPPPQFTQHLKDVVWATAKLVRQSARADIPFDTNRGTHGLCLLAVRRAVRESVCRQCLMEHTGQRSASCTATIATAYRAPLLLPMKRARPASTC